LRGIIDNQLSVSTVISDRVIKSSEEADKIVQELTKVAVDHRYSQIIDELSNVENMASTLPDPYSDVPEVRPVTVTTVGFHNSGSLLYY
jgi:hypothetical protein